MSWKPNSQSSKILFSAQSALNRYNFPISIKQLYYLLAAEGVLELTDASYRKFSTLMLNARRHGRIPPSTFVEAESIRPSLVKEPLTSLANQYTVNKMAYQRNYLEIWVDKPSLVPFVKGVVGDYGIDVYHTDGFSTYAFMYSAYKRLIDVASLDRMPRIIYLSDLEPSGLTIFEAAQTELAALLQMSKSEVSSFVFRAALLPEHLIALNLPYMEVESGAKTELFSEKYEEILEIANFPCPLRVDFESVEPEAAKGLILGVVFAILDYNLFVDAEIEELSRKEQLFKILQGD